MLIKQHTSAGSSMDHSILCLEATNEEPNVCRYYKCLGFSHVINFDNDNGLSQTSGEFQRIVRQKLDCWDNTSLNLFLLQHGRIILHKKGTINLTKTDNGLDSQPMKILVEFPWPASSMNQIESCIKSKPLFSHLSLSRLPETDRPKHYLQDKSTMHGTIHEPIWPK